jgi:hypothetical protein
MLRMPVKASGIFLRKAGLSIADAKNSARRGYRRNGGSLAEKREQFVVIPRGFLEAPAPTFSNIHGIARCEGSSGGCMVWPLQLTGK